MLGWWEDRDAVLERNEGLLQQGLAILKNKLVLMLPPWHYEFEGGKRVFSVLFSLLRVYYVML